MNRTAALPAFVAAIASPLFAGEPAAIPADQIPRLREQWLEYLGKLPTEKAPPRILIKTLILFYRFTEQKPGTWHPIITLKTR